MSAVLQKCLVVFFLFLLPVLSYAAPPYMWYATYSIENYDGNGDCGWRNLIIPHESADGFASALEARGISNTWRRYNRRDDACTAARWSGINAEINGVGVWS